MIIVTEILEMHILQFAWQSYKKHHNHFFNQEINKAVPSNGR